MDKKNIIRIVNIAVVVILVAIVAVVAIMRNSPEKYVDEDGNEHLLYIDEEGNTVLTDEGRVVVYATDVDGDIIEDDDGEPMTNAIDFPQFVVNENVLETPYYKMTMPEGWDLQEDGVYVYNENEDITFEIVALGEYTDDVSAYMNTRKDTTDALIEGIKPNFPASTATQEPCTITIKKIICRREEIKIAKSETDVYSYTNSVFFIYNGNLYKAVIACEENSYDTLQEDFDLVSLLNVGLAMKDKIVE